jgi:hypothetical protein
MEVIMKKKYFIYDHTGLYKAFNNYYHLLSFVSNGHWGEFGNSLKDRRYQATDKKDPFIIDGNIYYLFNTKLLPVKYVAYDKDHNLIPCKTLENDAANKAAFMPDYSGWHLGWRVSHENYPGFRKGPVPFTGRSNRGGYKYYRSIKTTQERRINDAHKEFIRAKRRNLPSAWDDLPRSKDRIKHSWKKQKKRKQWM